MPDFFIVGAPKCGTTAMYEYLHQHPDIFMPFHKEPLYFGSDLTRRYGAMTEDAYLRLFAAARPDQRIGEASSWYLFSTRAAAEIRAAAPDARIVAMLRNPVDVMYAQHSQLLFSAQEDIEDFSAALDAEPDRAAGRRLPPGPVRPENLLYRKLVRFAEQIERYLEVFGKERVHIIIHDDLRADLPAQYRRLLSFVGVAPDFLPDFTPANENKRVRRRWLQRMIWNPPLLRPFIPKLRRYAFVHKVRARLLAANSERAARAPMDPDLYARLQAELEPEVERLGRLIDRDLTAWTRAPDTDGR